MGVPTTLNILSSWSKTSRTPENNQFFLMLSYKGMVKQGQNTSSEAWYIGMFKKTASNQPLILSILCIKQTKYAMALALT